MGIKNIIWFYLSAAVHTIRKILPLASLLQSSFLWLLVLSTAIASPLRILSIGSLTSGVQWLWLVSHRLFDLSPVGIVCLLLANSVRLHDIVCLRISTLTRLVVSMYQRLPAPPLKPSSHLFSSPCSKPHPENDVFLNFRGEDTRNNFTDHLYRALEGKRIKTFKDDTKLEPGNPISLKLLDAIEKSRIAVVILSKNYASSTWCLEELVKILECMEEGGLTVLPIFYHVDPSHVRNQKRSFAEAFAEHENRLQKEQVEIWRKALRDVAKLSGKTLTNGYHFLSIFSACSYCNT